MGIQDLWTFVIAVLVFLALPGPGTFALLTATGRGGVRGGYTALFGLLLGDQILMWLAVAGVAALLKANPLVFHAVQYLGAAYLVWVGIGLLRPAPASGDTGGIRLQPGHYFRQAVLISLLNPKAIIFYMVPAAVHRPGAAPGRGDVRDHGHADLRAQPGVLLGADRGGQPVAPSDHPAPACGGSTETHRGGFHDRVWRAPGAEWLNAWGAGVWPGIQA